MPRTAIIVPCYNEENRLQPIAFQQEVEQHPDLHFYFVNDGSRDNTMRMLRDMCQVNPEQLYAINQPKNKGKAEAVRQGVLTAIAQEYELIGFWDADLATPLCHIHDFINVLNETPQTNVVMGSRVKLLGRNIDRKPLRHYLGRMFATCTSIILQLPVYDTQCGAKLFRNTPAFRWAFSRPFTVNWIFDVEILARLTQFAQSQGAPNIERTTTEYPLQVWTDVPGSKLKTTDFLRGGLDLLKVAQILYLPGEDNVPKEWEK